VLTIGTIILTYNWLFSSFYSFDSSPFLFREESKEKRSRRRKGVEGEKEKRRKGQKEKRRKAEKGKSKSN
jgi:hypothetical protein